MKFKRLQLISTNLEAQEEFYGKLLGFPQLSKDARHLVFAAGETELVFQRDSSHRLYHFAFLIPTGSLESAIEFVESKGINLLPLEQEKIIHFDSGRSIYFYDPDGNIAELIERPKLNYPPKESFEISDIIRINEIGHPVERPIEASHELIEKHGIHPINPKAFRENFCWVGDHEGAIIVVEKGRHWLPTQHPAEFNDFELEYRENDVQHNLSCKSGLCSNP